MGVIKAVEMCIRGDELCGWILCGFVKILLGFNGFFFYFN